MKKVFVTGGTGYIGSEFVHQLNDIENYEIVVFDNLEYGFKDNLPTNIKLIVGDLRDYRSILDAITSEKPDAVVHFAAYALVGESMQNPLKYFNNNITGGINLLMAMEKVECRRLIFSSTCATFGIPDVELIDESTEQNPINPYGQSKYLFEQILKTLKKLGKIDYTIFRYFNAAGSDAEHQLFERHKPETHMIPNAIKALKTNTEFQLFGNDYQTPDGTCVRDYIHIKDLAAAHILALINNVVGEFNLGTGNGTSNLSIINEIEKQTNQKIHVNIAPRRPGDPDKLIANPQKANSILNWNPTYSDLQTIIHDALQTK